MGIEYTETKKRQIEKAIKQLEQSEQESVKIDLQSSVDLSVTRADSELGEEIESLGKRGGFKQQPSYFSDEGVEFIIFSKLIS